MKVLILNADDYGLCESVNRAIIECLQFGIASDLSFLVNLDEFALSHEMLRNININNIGLHLNFTVGKSIVRPNSKLTNDDGYYYDLKTLIAKILLKEISTEDIYKEIKAQIELLINHNYIISHIDSHRNIHLLPRIMKPLMQINKEFDLNVPIRMPYEKRYNIFNFKWNNIIRLFTLNVLTNYCSLRTRYKWKIQSIGSNFFNNPRSSIAFDQVISLIKESRYKIFELPVHPGYPSKKLLNYDKYYHQRLWEMAFLNEQKDRIKIDGIKILSFSDVHSIFCLV
ncbi:MAG: carbohydrate deacetylase [Candidatus Hodarchaeota archaeon]